MSKRHPAKSPPSSQTATVFTDVGCIVHTGVTRVQLRHMQHQLTDEELKFTVKFIRQGDNGKLIHLSAGAGTPIFITVKDIHQTATGYYLTGEITRHSNSDPENFGTNLNQYRDIIPYSWFQKGNQIQLIHRGAATRGLIISITDPNTHSKIRLRTKNL